MPFLSYQILSVAFSIPSDFFVFYCIIAYPLHILVNQFKTWMADIQKCMHNACFVTILGQINEKELVTKSSMRIVYHFVLHLRKTIMIFGMPNYFKVMPIIKESLEDFGFYSNS